MNAARWRPIVTAGLLSSLAGGSPVAAQPVSNARAYVGIGPGTYLAQGDNVDDGTGAATVAVGIGIAPWLAAEFEFVKPVGVLSRDYTGSSQTFAAPGASREEIERLAVTSRFSYERSVGAALSWGVVLQPPRAIRWRPHAFVGLTTHRVREMRRVTPIRLPEAVDPALLARVVATEERQTRSLGALTAGVGVTLPLTTRLAIVPTLRYDYGSIGDELDNVLRTSVRFQWTF